jgi:hypothetical protein
MTLGFTGFVQGQSPQTFNTSGNFTAPAGVTSVTVECWGGGGRGGSATASAAGGGGGGAYSKKVVTVTPLISYSVVVGAGGNNTIVNGGDSYFISTSTIVAKGGTGVATDGTSGANGGVYTPGNGDLGYSGGKGANGSSFNYGGGGGSSAGTGFNGNNGSSSNGGAAPTGGGAGGNGATSSCAIGNPGIAPGGSGGGARALGCGTLQGGLGANGRVVITYISCTPPAAPTVTTPVNYCLNTPANPLTALGTGLVWYTQSAGGTGSSTAPTPLTSSIGTTSYYVSQTDGCEGPRALIAVIVNALPTFSVSKTDVTCYGKADGTIIVTATGGSGTGYTFSKDGSTFEGSGNPYTFQELSANVQYKIRVKDNNECSSPIIP